RLPHSREFQLSIYLAQRARILAPVAYLAVELVSRLPLHSARWKPTRRAPRLPQPDYRFFVVRAVAWRELAVCFVGPVAWRVPRRRARRSRPAAGASCVDRSRVRTCRGDGRVGAVPLRYAFACT